MSHPFHGDPRRLDTPARRDILPARTLLQTMQIKQGDVVIDFGAGIGYFSIPALDLVGPTGSVIAIDNSPTMIEELRKRAESRQNIIIRQASDLNQWIADKILLIAVLHELEDPKAFLNSCFSHLRPNGHVFVIDWQKTSMTEGPPLQERIAKEEVLSMTPRPHREHPIHKAFYFIEF